MKRKVFTTGFYLIFEKIIKIAVSFLTISLMAKQYELDVFGDYAYHMAIFTIINIVVNFGTEQIIVYNSSSKYKIPLINYFLFRLICSSICCAVLFVLSDYNLFSKDYFVLFSISFVLQSINVLIPYYQGLMNYKRVSFSISIALILSFALKVWLIYSSVNVDLSLIITADSFFISTMLLFVYLFDNKLSVNISDVKKDSFKSIFISSFPLVISALGIVMYSRLDQLMIKYFLGNNEVGLYASVIKLSEIFTFILPIVVNLTLSLVSKNFKNKKNDLFLNVFKAMNVYAIISIIVLFLFRENILLLVYTKDYLQVSNVLTVYSLSLIFITMGSMSNVWLIDNDLQKHKVKRVVLGLIVNVVLNFILIPKYGLMGAAVATVVSQFISSFIANLFNVHTRKLFMLQVNSLKVYKW